ncbi:hypothetical protein DN412_40110 [Cupriavidus lacunae]|uniref:Porin domain-containing protein n=1 Tax=Cupriavidus lacunae TaxID=2666307 RepID=A0A370NH06_9BURK|nr:hypothetical protein DN412_40110 [Cupriavidus lacunae]
MRGRKGKCWWPHRWRWAACAVDAQTSVTHYGVLDSNAKYVTNMSKVTPSTANGLALGLGKGLARMTSGGLSGSRWGLRGTEDHGPGLKALLVLESGFGVDDGRSQQGGRLFGRQAYVGLEHAVAGKLTFGRQYTSLFEASAVHRPHAT